MSVGRIVRWLQAIVPKTYNCAQSLLSKRSEVVAMPSPIEMILAQSSDALLESARFHERLGYVLMATAFLLLLLGLIVTIRRRKSKNGRSKDDDSATVNQEESTKENS